MPVLGAHAMDQPEIAAPGQGGFECEVVAKVVLPAPLGPATIQQVGISGSPRVLPTSGYGKATVRQEA